MEDINKSIVSVDSILGFLQEKVELKHQLNPDVWIDAAQKLVVLLGDEHDELFDLQQQVAVKKLGFLKEQNNKNVSAVKVRIEAEDIYKEFRKKEMRCKRIEEFIRIAKLRSRVAGGI